MSLILFRNFWDPEELPIAVGDGPLTWVDGILRGGDLSVTTGDQNADWLDSSAHFMSLLAGVNDSPPSWEDTVLAFEEAFARLASSNPQWDDVVNALLRQYAGVADQDTTWQDTVSGFRGFLTNLVDTEADNWADAVAMILTGGVTVLVAQLSDTGASWLDGATLFRAMLAGVGDQASQTDQLGAFQSGFVQTGDQVVQTDDVGTTKGYLAGVADQDTTWADVVDLLESRLARVADQTEAQLDALTLFRTMNAQIGDQGSWTDQVNGFKTFAAQFADDQSGNWADSVSALRVLLLGMGDDSNFWDDLVHSQILHEFIVELSDALGGGWTDEVAAHAVLLAALEARQTDAWVDVVSGFREMNASLAEVLSFQDEAHVRAEGYLELFLQVADQFTTLADAVRTYFVVECLILSVTSKTPAIGTGHLSPSMGAMGKTPVVGAIPNLSPFPSSKGETHA